MAEGPLPIVNFNQMNKEMMDTYGDVSNLPLWNQWWAAGKTTFPSPPQVPAAGIPYAQDELQLQDFVPDCAISYTPVQYDSIPAQHYPSPISQSFCGDSPVSPGSPGSPEDGRSSTSSRPELRKRKRNTTESPAAKSPGRRSSKKQTKPKSGETGETSKSHRKSQKIESALITPSPEEETDDYTCRVKERNRGASNKLRAKKRENAKKLKSDAEDRERINRHLSSCVADLTLEVYNLKMRLLQHTNYDYSLIQKYIADEAHHYISRLAQDQQSLLHH